MDLFLITIAVIALILICVATSIMAGLILGKWNWRLRLLLAAVLLSPILVGLFAFLRLFTLYPTIKITNVTQDRITNLKCVTSDSEQEWTDQFAVLEAGKSVYISHGDSDLFVDSLEYRIGDTDHKGGVSDYASWREYLHVKIGDAGVVSVSHESRDIPHYESRGELIRDMAFIFGGAIAGWWLLGIAIGEAIRFGRRRTVVSNE